mmetsp:Transcript_105349/g.250812  ORF Transcript_105349/g.250812 Transcript_105349/m.250812 type:complete len:206 (+) Transcript_105349:461-1078(+)
MATPTIHPISCPAFAKMIFTVNETLRFPPQSPRIAWNVGKKAAEALEQANARNLNAMTSWLTKLRRRNRNVARMLVRKAGRRPCRSLTAPITGTTNMLMIPSVADSMADCLTADCTTYFLSPQKELPEKISPPASSHLMNERSTGSINMCLRVKTILKRQAVMNTGQAFTKLASTSVRHFDSELFVIRVPMLMAHGGTGLTSTCP